MKALDKTTHWINVRGVYRVAYSAEIAVQLVQTVAMIFNLCHTIHLWLMLQIIRNRYSCPKLWGLCTSAQVWTHCECAASCSLYTWEITSKDAWKKVNTISSCLLCLNYKHSIILQYSRLSPSKSRLSFKIFEIGAVARNTEREKYTFRNSLHLVFYWP